MEKINIAELLKDCPQGMELDCTMYEGVVFECIVDDNFLPIRCRIKNPKGGYNVCHFTEYGCWSDVESAKCVIFPKGKTTWDGFVPPYQFKDGDVIFVQYYDLKYIAIIQKIDKLNNILVYCLYSFTNAEFAINMILGKLEGGLVTRIATEEEKQRLFDAIKANGYRWNKENKTLEKLPKFKVGDEIVKRNSISNSWIVSSVSSEYYGLKLPNGSEDIGVPVSEQDEWELVPNKFDITTLKTFESKVLVRSVDEGLWKPAIYGFSHSNGCYVVGGACWKCCIPYEGNEHLLGTTNDCADFYKTWEK